MNRTAVLFVFLFVPTVALATTLVDRPVVYQVPVIPHGLDWSILVVPSPALPAPPLSEEEVRQIAPRVIQLGQADGILDLGRLASRRDESPLNPVIALIAGTALLLAAYELIPRVQAKVLRFRSVNLNRDLFS